MNDEAARQSRPAITTTNRSGLTVASAPAEPTRLQTWLVALLDTLTDAGQELDEREWPVFVSVAWNRIGMLAAPLILDEILRADREHEERDAA